ncbi:MAG TPA: hypothetical protein VK850_09795 [Candidatus Binatia bacterium]|nr:hypothetical protein [Candidatus Binatia bacterium]
MRFTLDGSKSLERHIASICQRALELIESSTRSIEGLLLGGGYGRGEGGVLRTESGDQPYNDLDFYVFMPGTRWLNEKCHARALHQAGEDLTSIAGVEVEFKIESLARLRRAPISMFSYDLLAGHRWIKGDESLLHGCEHHLDAERIPLHEGARLLLNRCSGLLFATDPAQSTDFIRRNIAKAQLALGDAVLTRFGKYHSSCLDRRERVKRLYIDAPWWSEVQRHHEAGVEFKLHPYRSTELREELARDHQAVSALARQVWLWYESHRLSASFTSVRDYAMSQANKCPETGPLKNLLINVKEFRRPSFRYPRERLFNSCPTLLWDQRPTPDLIGQYQSVWRRFN